MLAPKKLSMLIKGVELQRRPAFALLKGSEPAGKTAVFPGAFNPITRAHIEIIEKVKRRFDSVLVLFDTTNADKPFFEAPLFRRIMLADAALGFVSIGLCNRGLFLDNEDLLRRRLKSSEIWFVLGSDTYERLFDRKFYGDEFAEVTNRLARLRFIAFDRGNSIISAGNVLKLKTESPVENISATVARISLANNSSSALLPPAVNRLIHRWGLYGRHEHQRTYVVTSFLTRNGKVLILKRSDKVGSGRGLWAGVSGYIELPEWRKPLNPGETVYVAASRNQALTEIREEIGLDSRDVRLIRRGRPISATSEKFRTTWVIVPYLWEKISERPITLDWEHTEFKWICPDEFPGTGTVHGLIDTFRRVWTSKQA